MALTRWVWLAPSGPVRVTALPGLPAASQPPCEAPADERGRARGARCRAAASPGRWARRPVRRPGRDWGEGGEGRVGAEGAALPCIVLPWPERVFATASGSGLCLPRVFCAGRRSSSASAGGDRTRRVLPGCLYGERGREVFVTSCCVSRKPRECSFSGLPWNADFLGGGRFLKKRVKGSRGLYELKNGRSRNCVFD